MKPRRLCVERYVRGWRREEASGGVGIGGEGGEGGAWGEWEKSLGSMGDGRGLGCTKRGFGQGHRKTLLF